MRHDTVDWHGKVTLRYDSRLHHMGLSRAASLILDPKRDYQRQSA